MTGGEKILARILEDAQIQADQIEHDAEDKAKAILAQAEAEAQRQTLAILESGRAQADALVRTAQSNASQVVRNALLKKRRALIEKVLNDMLDMLRSQPDTAYFDMLLELAKRAARPENGIMFLNARDLQRLPADFAQRLHAQVSCGSITISDRPHEIDGGFVLQYGDLEMNCSFAAMLEERREEMEDLVNRELFAETADHN